MKSLKRNMTNWKKSLMLFKNKFIIFFMIMNYQGVSQENSVKVDSLESKDFHFRLDAGFSILHFLEGSNPKYHQHFYIGASKNNPKWKFTPGISFLYSNSRVLKDSLYYGKKIGSHSYYLALNLIKNNFPKKEKLNLYYGISLGGYLINEGVPGRIEFAEKNIFGINLTPLIGLDLKIRKNLRCFSEFQLGLYSQKIEINDYYNGAIISTESRNVEFFFFAFIPLKFGITFIL